MPASFTGHSLGGGLAYPLATGLPATIYNPAGLSDNTVNDSTLKLNVDFQLMLKWICKLKMH